MRFLYNVPIDPALIPPLDAAFIPASVFNRGFRKRVSQAGGVPLRLALERAEGVISTYSTEVPLPNSADSPACLHYVERIVKFLLWQHGGWKLTVGGPKEVGEHIRSTYSPSAPRAFDYEFMSRVYEKPFTVVITTPEAVPEARENPIALGRHLDGCRVGFDLGASDRKSSAVIDGKVVFSEEVPWDPRNASDPNYHYQGVLDSIRRAAAKLPKLEAVGGSSAGVYVANRARIASLFRGVSRDDFEQKIAGMFLRIRDELNVPIEVINDGEVTALSGSMSIGDNPVLGIAMGSSQAAGYVDAQGHITGGLNELAFAPIDYRTDAPADEWSGDIGCGVQYFSQVGAIRVASASGMQFNQGLGLPEKLVVLQERIQEGDSLARQVYETVGIFLGYGLAHYADFYNLKHVLILGRVTTGLGGDIILEKATEVLRRDFPEKADRLRLALPDESNRRVGQSIAAASLPALREPLSH